MSRPVVVLLYVPADRPDRIGKALTSGADGIIVDLEDAVAPSAKDAARGVLATLPDLARSAFPELVESPFPEPVEGAETNAGDPFPGPVEGSETDDEERRLRQAQGSAEGLVDLRVYAASVAAGFMMSSNSMGVSFPSRR